MFVSTCMGNVITELHVNSGSINFRKANLLVANVSDCCSHSVVNKLFCSYSGGNRFPDAIDLVALVSTRDWVF